MAIRFKVTFDLLHPYDTVSYEICSLGGANKAIVIATQKHSANGKGHILSAEVTELAGEKPVGTDLMDRMEW